MTKHGPEGIKIRISQLSNGVHEHRCAVSAADLSLDERFTGDVTAKIRLEKENRQLYLSADVLAAGRFECDRCLESFDGTVSGAYQVLYMVDAGDGAPEDGEDVRVIHQETSYLDLTDDVRQTIVLAVPLKLLCREECLGLCPRCGTNLNRGACSCPPQDAESRWDPLKKLYHH